MADERDQDLRQYLLGSLPEPAMQAIETSYFTDASAFERVEQAEHALIDDFLEQRLPSVERRQFETHFLAAPARARRVAVSQALRETATKAALELRPQEARSPTRLWLAVAASIVVALGLWFVLARPAPPPVQQAGDPSVVQPLPPPAEPPQPPRKAESPIVALVLSPVSTRGAESPADIRSSSARLEIDLLGGGRPAAGRVEIRSVDAGVVWTGNARAASAADARGALAQVTVPMDRLPSGDYILTLLPGTASNDAVPVATYYFRVLPP